MQRTDLAMNLGPGVQYVKYTFTAAEVALANSTTGLTQTILLQADPGGIPFQTPGTTAGTINSQNFQIPAGAVPLYVRFKHTAAWAGPSITSITATVQKTGGTNFTTPGTLVSSNITAAVADTTLTEFSGFASSQQTAYGLCVLFTAIGANLSVLTAGGLDIYIAYLNVSTP